MFDQHRLVWTKCKTRRRNGNLGTNSGNNKRLDMDDYAEANMLAPSRSRKQANSGLTRVFFLFTWKPVWKCIRPSNTGKDPLFTRLVLQSLLVHWSVRQGKMSRRSLIGWIRLLPRFQVRVQTGQRGRVSLSISLKRPQQIPTNRSKRFSQLNINDVFSSGSNLVTSNLVNLTSYNVIFVSHSPDEYRKKLFVSTVSRSTNTIFVCVWSSLFVGPSL